MHPLSLNASISISEAVPAINFQKFLEESKRSKIKMHITKENMWNADDDADEMNIGEVRTNFSAYGIADCMLEEKYTCLP